MEQLIDILEKVASIQAQRWKKKKSYVIKIVQNIAQNHHLKMPQ